MYALATLTRKFAEIERLPAFRNVREQHIHEGVLAVECRTSLIFRCNDPLDCREVALAERVVLRAEEVFSPSTGLHGFDPNAHDLTTYERRHLLRPISPVKEQSIAVVIAVIDGQAGEWHGVFLTACSRSADLGSGIYSVVLRSFCCARTCKRRPRHPNVR